MNTFYCTIGKPSGQKILYIGNVKTLNRENYEAKNVDDFKRLIQEHGIEAVMFEFWGFPRRAVVVGHPKLESHLKRLVKQWQA